MNIVCRTASSLDQFIQYIPPERGYHLYSSSVGKDFVIGYAKVWGDKEALDAYLSDWKDRTALIREVGTVYTS